MRKFCTVATAVVVACAMASGTQAAMVLYEQTFADPAPPQNGAILPWSVNMIGGFQGTYSGSFDAMGLRDAVTDQPIKGNTGVFTGIGGPVTNDLRLFYTIDGQAGFTAFDPATCPGLTFNIYANTQGGGVDDVGRFAVFAGGPGPRDPANWYVSTTPMGMPTQNQGALFDLRSLLYNPAAGNWNNLTVDTANAVAPVVGGPAGSLAGLYIRGVGVLHSVTNPEGDFSSWNYAYYHITCIPEPTTIVLLAIVLAGGLTMCRRKSN
jgi:hypothetical protein